MARAVGYLDTVFHTCERTWHGAARRARVFVDRRESAFGGVGDILGPIASGAIRETDVLGDLYDLIGGAVPGRLGARDITLFKNAGGGHLDLMTAEAVLARLDGA